MKMGFKIIGKLIIGLIRTGIILSICVGILFVSNKWNQTMGVPGAPEGLTYFQYMGDKIEAAKSVEPSSCGWGMILSLAALGPIYSVVYTEAGIHPDWVIAKGIASDPDIPKDVADASWYEVPGIWWNTLERLSWTMLGEPARFGCEY
ncbi:MAG: hypothetical protein JEZ00_11510 [Anaerolineaceae bacterium]|nr:hypothetical protein [Anaerolineaceae bacterium]